MQPKHIHTIIAIIILFTGIVAEAQDKKTVTGFVTSGGQLPLNKAEVTALKSGEKTYTDSLGRFTINCSEKDALSVSASGFKERKIRLGKQSVYTIDLLYVDNLVNFNKAVSGGHITESALNRVIENNEKKRSKDYSIYNSIFELISSEVYDVSVKGTSVVNKKRRSMDSNPQILYVVDDKIVTDISYVNPTYVRSIEFIDDVGATLYGSKGANGVLKITLK